MMNFYHMPKPKGFHHHYIYVDERKERIKKMEEKAKQELGMEPSTVKPEDLRGTFHRATTHARKHQKRRNRMFLPGFATCLFIILLLVILCYFLAK